VCIYSDAQLTTTVYTKYARDVGIKYCKSSGYCVEVSCAVGSATFSFWGFIIVLEM
jgi:hypothetical protein